MNRSKKKFLYKECGYGKGELKYGDPVVKEAVKKYNKMRSEKVYNTDLAGKPATLSKIILGKNKRRKNVKGAFGTPNSPEREIKMRERYNESFKKKIEKLRQLNEQKRKNLEEINRKKQELESKEKTAEPEQPTKEN